jgi:arylsulfatase A-like enzyme
MENAVVILLDSLNRHLVGAYGGKEFATPNLDRLAARSVRFLNHHAGSLPCIPARHDLLAGSLDFLWKPWGSLEVWERPLTYYLRRMDVVTQLVTDHPHLFEHGGENYHADFYAWDYQRGGESDPWQTLVDETMIGTPSYHRPADYPYHRNHRAFRDEADYPGPRTMASAARWLLENAGKHDRFLLFVDEFDPHEPFDTPEPYASMYDPGWEGRKLIWPPYLLGALDPREATQIRAQYGGKLTMIDAWLGRVLDAMDEAKLWGSTLLILVTDHGHYLGEHGAWGKPPSAVYGTLGHIPLLVAAPGVEPGTQEALTTSVDIAETLVELFGIRRTRQVRHGKSLLPLLRGEATRIRDWVLQGYFGQRVNLIDDTMKYCRGVRDDSALSIYSNRWSTMHPIELPDPDDRATLGLYMPGSKSPVIRQPLTPAQVRRLLWTAGEHGTDLLFDLHADPDEATNLAGGDAREEAARRKLRAALMEIRAPKEQLVRLGL